MLLERAAGLLSAGWSCRVIAGCLVLLSAGLHLAYLAGDCPLDLAPDEAHYWDWSRHLDWSYYSKGPLVAYLIRGGCLVAGPWAEPTMGNPALAVRLPAVVCGSLLLVSLYVLTVQVFRTERLALAVVAAALTMPVVAAGSTLMTIDSPYTCCWGWAMVLGYQAVFRRSGWAWLGAGLIVGVGILAKYTMVLWIPAVGLFLLTSREHRRQLCQRGFWGMVGVAALCCLPILVWNAAHDWVTLRHVNGLAGMNSGPRLHWLGPLVYLGTQCALLLGFWFVAWLAALVRHRPWREADAGVRYLWWLSALVFAVFLGFSVKTGGGEPNWPITAYLSGLILAAAWLSEQLQSSRAWYRRWTIAGVTAACGIGLVLTFLLHHSDWTYPLLAPVMGAPTAQKPAPLRRIDPTCRLRGWQELAAEVDRLRDQLEAEGIEPILAGAGWSLPGELGFYCQGHPTVYSLGLALGDRRSQYDFWRPNPIWNPETFRGRTFIVVGAGAPLREAFDSIDPPRRVTHQERGYPVASWEVTVCRGYRGFRHLDALDGIRKF